jgi:hypothetical protein
MAKSLNNLLKVALPVTLLGKLVGALEKVDTDLSV